MSADQAYNFFKYVILAAVCLFISAMGVITLVRLRSGASRKAFLVKTNQTRKRKGSPVYSEADFFRHIKSQRVTGAVFIALGIIMLIILLIYR